MTTDDTIVEGEPLEENTEDETVEESTEEATGGHA